jgi:hypothetical protein
MLLSTDFFVHFDTELIILKSKDGIIIFTNHLIIITAFHCFMDDLLKALWQKYKV